MRDASIFERKTWVGLVVSEKGHTNLISFLSLSIAQFSFMRFLAISKHAKVEKWFIIPRLDQLKSGLS